MLVPAQDELNSMPLDDGRDVLLNQSTDRMTRAPLGHTLGVSFLSTRAVPTARRI